MWREVFKMLDIVLIVSPWPLQNRLRFISINRENNFSLLLLIVVVLVVSASYFVFTFHVTYTIPNCCHLNRSEHIRIISLELATSFLHIVRREKWINKENSTSTYSTHLKKKRSVEHWDTKMPKCLKWNELEACILGIHRHHLGALLYLGFIHFWH